jgi:assimilatory nitrate reductase catalytic subunit
MSAKRIRTTCPYCGVGCGVLVGTEGGRVTVQGDPDHPANAGRLCGKGMALGDTVGDAGRLLHPQLRGRQVSWFRALDEVAGGFRRVIDTYGPDAVAFYVSGQLLTEDYYVANKLMKGYIGGANIDTNSRLCMSSAVAGHHRAFGADLVPGSYADLDSAELVVLVGSNLAWCHPVLYRRLADARDANPKLKVVVIDPRRTATAAEADLHLALAPGSDAWLFNGLLHHLERNGGIDWRFLQDHAAGFAEARDAAARAGSIPAVARACELAEAEVAEFYRLFLRTERTVTVFSQGVNQSSAGTDKVSAILNCHLLSGRIGRPGSGPLSITGQPNAMGGREVGGLASTLAAHMGFDDAERVQRFWNSPTIARRPGLKAVELFEAVHDGRVRALWIMATNPAVSLPDADRVREALKRCEFLVVSDMTADTDTARWADVLLPAATWGERDGTVTNSERRISRQRPFRKPPGEARPDWWMICDVARRMGFDGFGYPGPAAIFDEHARLSAFENDGRRFFNLGGLAGRDGDAYDALEPIQWPVPEHALAGTDRLFADHRFATGDGRARFAPVTPRPPAHPVDDDFPIRLNTGRVRDHWHTMSRSARSPRLCQHADEPRLALHPADVRAHGLRAGAPVRVQSRWGEAVVRVAADEGQRPGDAFLPIHWNDQYASQARAGALVNPARCPESGQPELKHTPVRVVPIRAAWHGFLLARRPRRPDDLLYWVRVPGDGFERHELAGDALPDDWQSVARSWLGACHAEVDWLEYQDSRAGHYRAAWLRDGRLQACLFASPEPSLPDRQWLAELMRRERLTDDDRISLLAARPPSADASDGPTICSCVGIGRRRLTTAIREQRLGSVDAVGEALGAGTRCGSCIPEIRSLLGQR